MKSGRQRWDEIKAKRDAKARVRQQSSHQPLADPLPMGVLAADQDRLLHDNTWGPRPRYYVDKPFVCVDCLTSHVWTAPQQKWWYEVAKGNLASRAQRCRDCRFKRRMRRSQERRVHIEGLINKIGITATAARLKTTVADLERMRAAWDD